MTKKFNYESVPESARPILIARESSITDLSHDALLDPEDPSSFNPGSTGRWNELETDHQYRLINTVTRNMVFAGVPVNGDQLDPAAIREDLARRDDRTGSPGDYKEGVIGLLVNRVMASVARQGFVDRSTE